MFCVFPCGKKKQLTPPAVTVKRHRTSQSNTVHADGLHLTFDKLFSNKDLSNT